MTKVLSQKKKYHTVNISKSSLGSLGLFHMQIMGLMGRLICENWSLTFFFGQKITNDFTFKKCYSQPTQQKVTFESAYL